ncbi:glycosyltransferase, group 1 family protein [Clostridiales bacterium oral taxon 876 str. F0540]|nr:glycosyltransferase, group 1 family protein [Clostridiales bacterium oral taxon 876 str. F0540]
MKICFLGDAGSVHTLRWIEYFVYRNHEVHLITFSEFKNVSKLSDRENFYIHKIGEFTINSDGGNWKYLLSLKEIKGLLKRIKPDIVNAHYITSYGFLSSLMNVHNLVLSAWGSDILITPRKNKIYEFITRYALKKAKLITSDSEYMTTVINDLVKNEVITVPMGVEERLCSLARQEDNNKITILSLRTVDRNCNIDCIVRAFNKLCKRYGNVRLIIANNGPEIENIKKLVKQLDLESKVDFRGFISRDSLIELLLEAQMYVSIPDSDSTSVTLLEAMACGTIPIVSNIPANCEWIRDNYNGLIVKRIDDSLLYESFLKAIEDKDLSKSCLVENRKMILEKAIWNNNMLHVESKYLQMLVKK